MGRSLVISMLLVAAISFDLGRPFPWDPTPNPICSLPMDAGTECSWKPEKRRTNWYHNGSACVSFEYKRCGGNGNNFFSKADCKFHCGPGPRASARILYLMRTGAGHLCQALNTTQVLESAKSSFMADAAFIKTG